MQIEMQNLRPYKVNFLFLRPVKLDFKSIFPTWSTILEFSVLNYNGHLVIFSET